MGITIHYRGKAKSLAAIDELIETVKEIALAEGWRYREVDEKVKGKYEPFWGIGYGFIPSRDRMEMEGIEFFPNMISQKCNGYFRLFHTKHVAEVRTSLEQGIWPTFSTDTKRKGIQISLHPKCENLNFIFDLKTLALADYNTYAHHPGIIYGSERFSCKTQFAGFAVHEKVCKLIKIASRYIDFSEIDDESGYYTTGDAQSSKKEFEALGFAIHACVETLKEMGMETKTGDEF